ncbi:1238_t:CDS:2 [Funneliformis geosporum]|nr:1238_t:CDS:2 [Funneliformis geosporum]
MASGDLKEYNEATECWICKKAFLKPSSEVSQQNISKENYEHAQKVWQVFEIKNFGKYHDLYLETNVLLLADVFINYTIISGAELKLMTDMDEYLIVESSIREGITMASHRYAKANNLKCSDYNSSKPKTYVMYENMNAMYSGAMTQNMPIEILGKISSENVPNIQSILPDAKMDYMLEVDLEVPVHLYDFFADFPLASEK